MPTASHPPRTPRRTLAPPSPLSGGDRSPRPLPRPACPGTLASPCLGGGGSCRRSCSSTTILWSGSACVPCSPRSRTWRSWGEATTASGAVRAVTLQRPDLVVLDVHLEGGPLGPQLCRTLKSSAGTAVLVLAARAAAAEVTAMYLAGADSFVDQTAPPGELVASVRATLGGRRVWVPGPGAGLAGRRRGRARGPPAAAPAGRSRLLLRLLRRRAVVLLLVHGVCPSTPAASTPCGARGRFVVPGKRRGRKSCGYDRGVSPGRRRTGGLPATSPVARYDPGTLRPLLQRARPDGEAARGGRHRGGHVVVGPVGGVWYCPPAATSIAQGPLPAVPDAPSPSGTNVPGPAVDPLLR
ncbi:response regulator [Georgenia sp. SUBG003]|uniref:response regulator n=1 Tax=Georgenia sp. SUBG003 TaxID=1497974 RepID=UPI003AB5D2E3